MQTGEERHDAYVVRTDPALPWIVAVVADGVSSSMNAGEAAAEAVAHAGQLVLDRLRSEGPPDGPHWWTGVFERTAIAIAAHTEGLPRREPPAARRRMMEPSPAATTLAVLVAPAEPTRDLRLFSAVVGDSRILRLHDGAWSALLDARDSTTGSDRVQTLPRHPEAMCATESVWRQDEVLVLATDGFADAIGPASPLALALADRWRRPPSLPGFLRDVDFRKATYNDDRTVIALWQGNADSAVA
ncbi:serine/threonine protein phosphatase PrpC [Streptomyces sp. CG 926]|nr:serine/threonine protein phosphatase PrpC [Streptomyces sp. CG 926]